MRATLAIALILLVAWPARGHGPHDVVYHVAVSPGFATDQTILLDLLLTDHALLGRTSNGGQSWLEYGSPVLAQDIAHLAMSPDFTTDGTAFAATLKNGVWRSTDGGVVWEPVSAGFGDSMTWQVAVSPDFALDRVVLAATAGGLLRSTDGGDTWAPIATGLAESNLRVVAFAPGAPQIAFTGGNVVHRSDDSGVTWAPLQSFAFPMDTLAASPSFPADSTLAACFGGFGDGVVTSTDGGTTWLPSLDGLTDPYVNDVAIAEDGTLFAATRTAGAFRADAPQGTWSLFNEGFEQQTNQTDSHYRAIVPSPDFATDDTVFVGAFEGFFESNDRGETWDQSDVYHQRINRRIAISPDFQLAVAPTSVELPGGAAAFASDISIDTRVGATGLASQGALYAANYGIGPTVHRDGRWTPLATDLDSLYSSVLAVSPGYATDRVVYYGYVGLWRSDDAGQSWVRLFSPVGIPRTITLSPEYLQDQTVFIGSAGEGTFRSSDAGASWTELRGGLPTEVFGSTIALSPGFPGDPTLYVATADTGIFRSTDGGTTWATIAAEIPEDNVRSLALPPTFRRDPMLLAGTVGAGLWRSTDGGDSWAQVTAGVPPDDVIEHIAFSPDFRFDDTVFAGSLQNGVLRSTDGGLTWEALTTDLQLAAARWIVLSPSFALDDTLFVSSFSWIWMSNDRGDSWSRLPGDLRVDDRHPTVKHDTTWSTPLQLGVMGTTISRSDTPDAWRELEFFGNSLEWFAVRDMSSGIARVLVDGELAATIDLWSAEPQVGAPVFSADLGSPAWHTVRIEVTGTAAPAATGAFIKSDGFRYRF